MIFKIALFIFILFLIYLIFFKKGREQNVHQNEKTNKESEEIMIECPTCKVFVSKKESILSNGKNYCSKECLR